MAMQRDRASVDALARELVDARAAFTQALADVDPGLLLTPGLVGDWSARELLAHVGYWAGHAAEALHQAELNASEQFGADELDVDERNAVVARVARETDMRTVRQREEAAFDALLARLQRADPAWLEERTAYGDTLEQVVRDDGIDHYREHVSDLRAWFAEGDQPADDEEADAESDGDEEADMEDEAE
jgi:hypothetical protein